MHGTVAAYQNNDCRCEPCRKAYSRYMKRLRLDHVRGKPRTVDPSPARDHVAALRAQGMSLAEIAVAAGYTAQETLRISLARPLIRRGTLDRVLAVTFDGDNGLMDATGTCRRLQALATLGWPAHEITSRTGVERTHLGCIRSGKQARTRGRIATAVKAVYDELWDKPGPSEATRVTARGNDWAPPLAWDDDTIDDPSVRARGRRQAGHRDATELLEDYLDTWDEHLGDVVAAAGRLAVKPQALARALYRARARGVDVRFTDTTKPLMRSA